MTIPDLSTPGAIMAYIASLPLDEQDAALDALPKSVLDALELTAHAEKVKALGMSAEGFEHFYWCIFGRQCPPMAKYVWIPALIDAYENKTGVLLECFRGSTKSTLLLAWLLFVTGWRPVGSSQLVRISDNAAKETDKAIAGVIEHNPGWKACFPNVVPDKEKGWSSEGRFLIDTNVKSYGEWTKLCFSDHLAEPNILCAGITSGSIIGKHPSNGQYLDDFHDEENTRSAREMQNIVGIIEKNIVPTWTRPDGHPTLGVACTFWSEHDGYQSLLRTGLFKHIKTPIFVTPEQATEITWLKDTPIEKDINDIDLVPVWPKAYTGEKIRETQRANPVYFPLMYLCDLTAAKGKVLKREWLAEYPAEKIGANWATYFGIDFASTDDQLNNKDSDYFSICIWRAIPGGGMVMTGGVRVRLMDQEAVAKAKAIAGMQTNLSVVGIEKWGAGNVFKNNLLYTSSLPILALPIKGTPVKSKGQRFAGGLAPLFTTGRAWISDVHDEFIKFFIEEWISWDGQRTATDHDDCLDAAYWGAMAGQGHLMPKPEGEDLPTGKNKKSIKQELTRKALSFGVIK